MGSIYEILISPRKTKDKRQMQSEEVWKDSTTGNSSDHSDGEDTERKKPPIPVDAGANECTHYRTQFRDFSKQLKEELP